MKARLSGGPKDRGELDVSEGVRRILIPQQLYSVGWWEEGSPIPLEVDPVDGTLRMKRPPITYHVYEKDGEAEHWAYRGEEGP